MSEDRAVLIEALDSAEQIYARHQRQKGLLGASVTDPEILDPVVAAIEKCDAFKSVKGKIIYSADSGPVIQASILAVPLLYRASRDVAGAADWLIRVLGTRHAKGRLNAAIWGLSLDNEVRLSDAATLIPFTELPDSEIKQAIARHSVKTWDGSAWSATNYFDAPKCAFVRVIPDFPYIGNTNAPFKLVERALEEVRESWNLLEGLVSGQPLAIGYWFDYEDSDLDILAHENHVSWSLPEVAPQIKEIVEVDATTLKGTLDKFGDLPGATRADLLRSMKRFTLSQCRHQDIDRVLDLALAFEIPFSDGGGGGPISWKVGLRSAQLIGGDLDKRKNIRLKINKVFDLRNKGTHGSSLKDFEPDEIKKILNEASDVYRILMRGFLRLDASPDWRSIELEPPFKN